MKRRVSKAREKATDRILEITSGAGRRNTTSVQGVPDVYRQLLTEVSNPEPADDQPRKRRRVGGSSRAKPVETSDEDVSETTKGISVPPAKQQTVIQSDDSDDSDFDEWEEVETNGKKQESGGDIDDVTVVVGGNVSTPKKSKRKALSTSDKRLILATHKAHVVLLLFHAHVRNKWCSLQQVHTALRPFLSAKIISLLNPRSQQTQLRQSELFLDGLKQAADLWKARFRVTSVGMHRSMWVTPEQLITLRDKIVDTGESLNKAGFSKAAKSKEGSQDLGNQLFCALMRAVGVEARLVCSLQVLPPTAVNPKIATPQRAEPGKSRIYATFEHDEEASASDDSKGSTSSTGVPPPRRRIGRQPVLGGPVRGYKQTATAASLKRKAVEKFEYPAFWVEVLNPAYEQWVTVDPIVTGTISKASKIEPPASYEGNTMSYVIAFDDEGYAKDVTRRYTRAYNAKTRKLRVESFPDGQKWFAQAMKLLQRPNKTDRDQIEDGELSKKESQEGLPSSLQDFKDHPHYALERHLKRNEIIWPKRQVGKINGGKGSANKLEPIYRRQDVQLVQSADKWYRQGQEIKAGEQPLKHAPARSRRQRSLSMDGGEAEMTGLYALHQTEAYLPPPVVRGKVPKNMYGNIDIYTPTMIPPGGSHIRHPLAKKAAQKLKIDFADAVTGFQFKGRQGTAIIQGVVVATIHKTAMESTIQDFVDAQKQSEDNARSNQCLRLWRRFVLGLQIAQRIGLTDIHAANEDMAKELWKEMDEAEDEHDEVADAGGFFPDGGADDAVEPTAHRFVESQDGPSLPVETWESESRINSEITSTVTRKQRRRPRAVVDDEDEDTYPNMQGTGLETSAFDARVTEVGSNLRSSGKLSMTVPSNDTGADEDSKDVRKIHAEEDGGGFLHKDADQNSMDQNTIQHSNEHVDEMQGIDDTAGGFFVEIEDEVKLEGDSHGTGAPANNKASAESISSADDHSSNESKIISKVSGSEQVPNVERHESESEPGSLLSHDPEDEDADPEWLAEE